VYKTFKYFYSNTKSIPNEDKADVLKIINPEQNNSQVPYFTFTTRGNGSMQINGRNLNGFYLLQNKTFERSLQRDNIISFLQALHMRKHLILLRAKLRSF